MNVASPLDLTVAERAPALPGVLIADRLDGLAQLADPETAAVICESQVSEAFQTWLDRLGPAVLPSTRVILRPGNVPEMIEKTCAQAGLPASVHRQALVSDICALCQVMTDLLSPPFLRVRLSVVSTNSCRKFHIDAVTARLVCTYRGPGTQYGQSIDDADPQVISDVPTGAPIVLRGTLWPERPASGLRHRSPPIEGSGQTRLVLVVDPIFDPEDEE